MTNLEHIKLLEEKISQTLEYIQAIVQENKALKMKVQEYRAKNDELEVLVKTFREDQNKIEDSILAALDRLHKFESAIQKGIDSISQVPEPRVEPVTLAKPEEQALEQPPAQSETEVIQNLDEEAAAEPMPEENTLEENSVNTDKDTAAEDQDPELDIF